MLSLLPALRLSLVWAATLSLALTLPTKRATVCNGHAEFCSRLYSNVTYIGSHDSFAFSEDPFALARDQEVDIPTQLGLGIRLLQAQAHMNDGVLHFCHTSCALFDGGAVVDYLKNVKTFLDANPNEVLTLLFTNPEGASVSTVWKPAFDDAGISDIAFVPPSLPVKQSDWPTLGSMIDTGKRVVVFLDAGADGADTVDFILPEFAMIWETPFSVTNASFPCSINRIHGPLGAADHMYMINHSLNTNIIPIGSGVIISDPLQAPTTNGVSSWVYISCIVFFDNQGYRIFPFIPLDDSFLITTNPNSFSPSSHQLIYGQYRILANAAGCTPLGAGRAPSFVLIDFVNLGNAFAAADQLNGLSAMNSTNTTTSSGGSSSSNSAGGPPRPGALFVVYLFCAGLGLGVYCFSLF